MICVDISDYVRSHGRDPKGRGLWMFQAATRVAGLGFLAVERSFAGTYGEARRKALGWVSAEFGRLASLKVLP